MSENDYTHRPSRRTVLRTMGASLALPFLPSLAWNANGDDKDTGNKPPRRLAIMLFSNGVNAAHWWQKADAQGRLTELSKTLQPIKEFKDDLLFINNLHLFDDTVGVHTPYFANFLTGKELAQSGLPNQAESLDHMVGRTVGNAALVPSIALGTEAISTISWSSPTTPIPVETFPQRAFDRLFDTSALIRDKKLLDMLLVRANALRGSLSAVDRSKLDEYLTSIKEIEARIEKATKEDQGAGWRPSLKTPKLPRPEGRPREIPAYMKLMLDIMVLGLQMDKTRVTVFIFQNDISSMTFNFLPGVSNTGMHTISHHRKDPAVLEEYQKINEFHVAQLKHVLQQMKSVDEGNGTTLLDNTMLLFGSTMMDGDVHDANQLPLILCGGKSAGIKSGRVLSFDKLEERRLCNLHLELARRMGSTIDKFGNSTKPLPGMG